MARGTIDWSAAVLFSGCAAKPDRLVSIVRDELAAAGEPSEPDHAIARLQDAAFREPFLGRVR
ncbi:MAG TPA: hypothetical protein VE591_00120 [Candidatus Acidoferrum sp.]|nr:hypothetical protein [Candidatus Acidoferrum sp.]